MKKKNLTAAYPVASVCLLVGIVGIATGVWRQSVIAEIQADAEAKEAEANVFAQNLRNAQRLEDDLAQLRQLNESIAARTIDPDDLAGNQQFFYQIEADSGVKILELRKGAAVSSSGKKTPPVNSPIAYTVSIEGPFARLLAFVRNIEGGAKIARITSAMVASPRNAVGNPEAVLTMSVELELLGKS